MEFINTCMNCANQWEENQSLYCPQCGSGDFYAHTEYEYDEINIIEALSFYKSGYWGECDGDKKIVKFTREE